MSKIEQIVCDRCGSRLNIDCLMLQVILEKA